MNNRFMFHCNGCDTERDFETEYGVLIITINKELNRYCKLCRSPRASVPDVFWDGKPEENLADDPRTGKPPVFLSKGHKASYLKERNLQEAGDSVHGAPLSFARMAPTPKVNSREAVLSALKRARGLSHDVRHREYMKIKKEGLHAKEKASR